MTRQRFLAVFLLCSGAGRIPALAQSAGQVWPEFGVYLQQTSQIRLEFIDSATGNLTTHSWQGNSTFFFRAALKPVFRRKLRDQPDVFRDKYLTFAAGYRYRANLSPGNSGSENRAILEVTSRYQLPWHLTISDRNRGEFRFIKDQPFSTRYRNRLQIERDIEYGSFTCTPFVNDEIFYDSRYAQWIPNRLAFGVEFPLGKRVVLEPYYMRQHNSRSSPPNANTAGFKLNVYLNNTR